MNVYYHGIMDVYYHYGVLYDCVVVSSWQVLLRLCMRRSMYQLKMFSLKASSKKKMIK